MFGRGKKKERSQSVQVAKSSSKKAGSAGRSLSCPVFRRPNKSNMKFVTADESLHKKYKESRKNTSRNLQFDAIEIREYARTVGDNPSCSSGAPIS